MPPKKNCGPSLILILPLVILLVVLSFFLLFPRKKVENFFEAEPQSSRSILVNHANYTNAAELDQLLDDALPGATDNNELLLARRGYQFHGNLSEVKKALLSYYKYGGDTNQYAGNNGMYVIDFETITCNFNEINSKIICEVTKFYEEKICNKPISRDCTFPNMGSPAGWTKQCSSASSTGSKNRDADVDGSCFLRDQKINGPVYVLIFQAPYYRNYKDEQITLLPNISEYNLTNELTVYNREKCNNVPSYDSKRECSTDIDVPIYYYVQILFSRYNEEGTFMPYYDYMGMRIMDNLDSTNMSKASRLFINAVGAPNAITFGGCATITSPYAASCWGPKNIQNFNDKENVPSSFGVLYTVNPRFLGLSKMMVPGMKKLTSSLINRYEGRNIKQQNSNTVYRVEDGLLRKYNNPPSSFEVVSDKLFKGPFGRNI